MVREKSHLLESEYVRNRRELERKTEIGKYVNQPEYKKNKRIIEHHRDLLSHHPGSTLMEGQARLADVSLRNLEIEHKIRSMQSILTKAISSGGVLDLDNLKEYPRVPAFDPGDLAVPITPPNIHGYKIQISGLIFTMEELKEIFAQGVSQYAGHDLEPLKKAFQIPVFDPGELATSEPPPDIRDYMAGSPKGHSLNIVQRIEQMLPDDYKRYVIDLATYKANEAARQKSLAEAKANYERTVQKTLEAAEAHNVLIDSFKQELAIAVPDAICDYYLTRLAFILWPDGFPDQAKLAYVPESKQLVVEWDLPSFDIVPDVAAYRYIKSKNEIAKTQRPLSQRKTLYNSIIAQIVLAILHILFNSNHTRHIETIVLNGYIDSVDRATGRPVRPCLVTVRTTRETFDQLDLSKVDPASCLKFLNASVSKSPTELAPVRPVLELNMVDARFIQEADVLAQLDQRPNLMDLSPKEFESLITNLFQKMGLETRQTQASRDGGVDCVAFDNRPIFGGKIVIQAKRYKNTVGVSAVRDLFGTVQNEGASKGILVATSGYGAASYEFAKGKPLELLDGSNLLALLAEYAGIEAKIVMPEDWMGSKPDSVGNT